MRSVGENRWWPVFTIFIRPRIICSQALKSAITPSRNGRTTRILLLFFSYISLARSPTAIILFVWLSSATTDGSSTAILSSLIMMVLAVPRSIDNSWVNEKNPIMLSPLYFLLFLLCLLLICQNTRVLPCRNGYLWQRRARQSDGAAPVWFRRPGHLRCLARVGIRPCWAR